MLTRSPVHAIALLRELSARFAELEDGGGEAGQWFIELVARS